MSAAGDALAVPAAHMPGTPAAWAPGSFAVRDVLTTAFLRLPLLILALILPVLAGVLAASVTRPLWPAEALLLVQASRESLGSPDPTGTGPTVMSVETPKIIQSEAELINSDAVLRRALLAAGPGSIFPGLGERRLFGLRPALPESEWLPAAADRLRRALWVRFSANSNVLRVTLSLPDAERARLALHAVLEAYFTYRAEVFAQGDSQLLSVETDRMAADLRALDAQISQVRSDARILDLPQDMQLANARIDSVTTRIDALRERKAVTDAQLMAASARLASHPQRVVATAESTNLAPNDDSRNELTRLLLERRHMAAQFTPDWPPLRALDQRISALRESIAANARIRFETVREVRNPAVEQISLRIATLEVEADAIGRQMEELMGQRREAEARAAALLNAESVLRDLGRRRDALEASFRQISGRETGARVAEDARRARSPTVSVLQPATLPARPRDRSLSFILAGLVGGVMLSAAAAILLTLTRRSYATTEEATRGLTLPVLASIPRRASLEGANPNPQITDLGSMLLDARASGERLSLLQFVSTGPEDGRGAIALAVAAEIARARGLRTLLIDLETDGRRHLAEMGASPMHDSQDPENVLAFSTVIPSFWIAYNAHTSLLTDPHAGIDRTVALLTRLRRELDVVVFVAPADSSAYAMRRLTALMDANVLVLRAERNDKGAVRRARDAVAAAGGKLVGFVMNGERPIIPRRLAWLAP
ncbi:GumC family protein [Sediminicoccus sp. BL-A-41-H5]|uniref:GumC family protein n=1 Tax=Sediminicoccus sp. BL-A-41-H5 TaxID=3421106 RepID=UPI003D6647C2